jgi:hypothetical protein
VKNEDLIKSLIIKSSDRIKYETVNSESIGCKNFIQIKLDYQKSEFAKCKYCLTIINCGPKCGISSLNGHKYRHR